MAWQDATSISKLSVQIEDGSDQTAIYGNGRHQIGVVVYVEAADDRGLSVPVTPEEIIQNTRLIDYVTGEELNLKEDKGWNYTDIENDYHNSIPNSKVTKQGSGKKPTYYVQCRDVEVDLSNASVCIESDNHSTSNSKGTKQGSGTTAKFYVQYNPGSGGVRPKSIAVKAILTNSSAKQKEWSTAEHGDFDSKVHLTALEEKTYTMDDMTLEREDTANQNKNAYYNNSTCSDSTCVEKTFIRNINFDQDNYYFYINGSGFYIKHAETSGYNETEGAHQVSKNAFYNRFPRCGFLCRNNEFNVGYIWEMSDKEQSKNVTIYKVEQNLPNLKDNISIAVLINQKAHSICLTRMKYKDNDENIGDYSFWSNVAIKGENLDVSFKTNITIYDQYGNKGGFNAKPYTYDENEGESTLGNEIKIYEGHQ